MLLEFGFTAAGTWLSETQGISEALESHLTPLLPDQPLVIFALAHIAGPAAGLGLAWVLKLDRRQLWKVLMQDKKTHGSTLLKVHSE